MMKSVILASLLASAAAFAPASVSKTSTATQLAATFDDDIGVTGTPGMWDPLNLVAGDQAKFDSLRFSEIKNGRVAMMAWLGYATTWGTNYRFPGCENFPGGHKAVLEIPPIDLLMPILAICGFLEVVVFKQKEGSFPGDMGGGAFPVGFGPYAKTAEQETKLRTNELLNGRAAMMGWLTLLVHEQIDGKPFIFFDSVEPYTPFGSFV